MPARPRPGGALPCPARGCAIVRRLRAAAALNERGAMRIAIAREESGIGGMAFGSAGPYEKIVGRAFGEVDPSHPLNAEIVNLDKAPRNAAGRVNYWMDFCLLKPADLGKGNRHLLYDALNRGD